MIIEWETFGVSGETVSSEYLDTATSDEALAVVAGFLNLPDEMEGVFGQLTIIRGTGKAAS